MENLSGGLYSVVMVLVASVTLASVESAVNRS